MPTHLFCPKAAWRRVGSEVRPCLLERAPGGVETTAGHAKDASSQEYVLQCFATLQVVNMLVFMEWYFLFGSVGITNITRASNPFICRAPVGKQIPELILDDVGPDHSSWFSSVWIHLLISPQYSIPHHGIQRMTAPGLPTPGEFGRDI